MQNQSNLFEQAPTQTLDITAKQKLVLKVIQNNPGVQNDDAALIAAVWRHEGWDEFDTLENNIRRVTRPETITRRRRELFNMNLIEYSPTAEKRRGKAFVNERDAHSSFIPPEVKNL